MKTLSINLYSFSELTGEAREKAINEHLYFLDSQPEEYETEDGGMKYEYVEHSEDEAIESLEINNYLFFADGEMAHVCTFTGRHEKAGQTEFYFRGQTLKI